MRQFLRVMVKTLGQLFSERGSDVFLTHHHFMYCLYYLSLCRFLREITGGSRPEDADRILVFRMNAEDQHRQLRELLADLLKYLKSSATRHRNVGDHHIPMLFYDEV